VAATTNRYHWNGHDRRPHFRCSGTHQGRWLGLESTGRSFTDVDEVYWFTVRAGRITAWWGLEDNEARLRQLGLRRDR